MLDLSEMPSTGDASEMRIWESEVKDELWEQVCSYVHVHLRVHVYVHPYVHADGCALRARALEVTPSSYPDLSPECTPQP